MKKAPQFSNITKWLRLFTYISGAVLSIANNSFDNLKYLIPLILLVIFVDYARDYWLVAGDKPVQYIWASIALELLLIMGIGYFDIGDMNILFFFVCLSSTVIIYPFAYAIPMSLFFFASSFLIHAVRHGFRSLMESMVSLLFSYGVSTVFVMGMSYLVKMQKREREKLAHINGELEQAYKKLIDNSAAVQKLTIEQERTRMAREIHDTLAHTLTSLIVQLEACKMLSQIDPSRLQDELDKAQELSRSGFNDVKRSIKALRPQIMEDKSFIASIHSIINETMENTKVRIKFNNLFPADINLSSQIEIVLFRVIQESITNAIRHGKASEIEISLKLDKNRLLLYISDNGSGCASIKKGYGTRGIIERIESLDGTVEFSSSAGKGFKTDVIIPCEVTA